MKKRALEILFLEALPADVEVVCKELEKGGLEFQMQHVETKEAFLYRLENHPPDLILSDHGIPHFSGFAALNVAKEKCPDVPFIFITGLQDEGFDVQTYANGATDHVHKSSPGQLVLAIKRALHHAEERKEFREQVEALRETEARYHTILETSLDAIVSIDFQGCFQEWNPAAERVFGYSRAEALGQLVDELIVPDALRNAYRNGLTEYLLTGACSLEGRPIQLTLRRKDRSEFPAELDISRTTSETPPCCTAIIRDISECKQIEKVLRASEERYRMLIEGAKDYTIYLLDPEGRVASWNAGAEHIEGYKAEEVMGKSFSMFFTPEDRNEGRPARILEKAKAEGVAFYERWQVRKDGSRFWSQRSISALRDTTGQLLGFSKIGRDVTERKKADERIRQLNQELEQRVSERTSQLEAANKELEAFSYSVSHDLRAPLRHILGYLEILRSQTQSNLNEEARHSMQMIEDSAQKMSDLIDALLDFSRLGRAEMHMQQVNLNALVKGVQHELRDEIGTRDVQWHVGELPIVRGDPLMLRQLWVNLISNALKFTRGRSPAKIEIEAQPDADQVTFFIRDNGAGFSMAYVHKLFGVFQRLHRQSEFEGIGIGLANVRRIIARHGGRIWAEGATGRGATFYFTLPTTVPTEKAT